MARTIILRRQHDNALSLVNRIIEAIDHFRGEDDAYPLTLLLAKLNGLLRIHFAQEDHSLYPRMIASMDDEVSATALSFQHEMGSLGFEFDDFMRRWSSSLLIARHFERFRQEAMALFAALGHRIERENNILYPLAERMAVGVAA